MGWINDLLSDHADGLSVTRVATLSWCLGALVLWSGMSLHQGQLVDIPPGVIQVLAILMAGKVIQRFGEKPG